MQKDCKRNESFFNPFQNYLNFYLSAVLFPFWLNVQLSRFVATPLALRNTSGLFKDGD